MTLPAADVASSNCCTISSLDHCAKWRLPWRRRSYTIRLRLEYLSLLFVNLVVAGAVFRSADHTQIALAPDRVEKSLSVSEILEYWHNILLIFVRALIINLLCLALYGDDRCMSKSELFWTGRLDVWLMQGLMVAGFNQDLIYVCRCTTIKPTRPVYRISIALLDLEKCGLLKNDASSVFWNRTTRIC